MLCSRLFHPFSTFSALPQTVPVLQSKAKARVLGFIQKKLQVCVFISFGCREIEGKVTKDRRIRILVSKSLVDSLPQLIMLLIVLISLPTFYRQPNRACRFRLLFSNILIPLY